MRPFGGCQWARFGLVSLVRTGAMFAGKAVDAGEQEQDSYVGSPHVHGHLPELPHRDVVMTRVGQSRDSLQSL